MTTIPALAQMLQQVFCVFPPTVADSSGFTRRQSKLTATAFVQTCVFGWLSNPTASLAALAQTASALGVAITPQGLDARFTEAAARLLEHVLSAVVRQVVSAEPVVIPLLQRFTAVYVLDSTTIALPDALAERWAGCGGAGSSAAVKLQVRLDLCQGTLAGPHLQTGRSHDATAELATALLPAGALRITDLGYFAVPVLAAIAAAEGCWLSRLHASPTVYRADGQRLEVGAWLAAQTADHVELAVCLGTTLRLPARLLAARVPLGVAEQRRRRLRTEAQKRGQTPSVKQLAWADWTLYVTNVPAECLSLPEGIVLGHARWQIELLFKQGKSDQCVDEWRSGNCWRILCEVYAKLIGSVLTHWLTVVSCWRFANRSLRKAGQTIQRHALRLGISVQQGVGMSEAMGAIQGCLGTGCRLNTRKQVPNTYQFLLDPSLLALG